MEYQKILRDSWNYYKKNPVVIAPYLLLTLFVESVSLYFSINLESFGLNALRANITSAFVFGVLVFLVSIFVVGLIIEIIKRMENEEELSLSEAFISLKEKSLSLYGADFSKLILVVLPPLSIFIYSGFRAISNFYNNLSLPDPGLFLALAAGSIVYVLIVSLGLLFVEEEVVIYESDAIGALKNSFHFMRANLISLIVFIVFFIAISLVAVLLVSAVTSISSLISGAFASSVNTIAWALVFPYLLMIKVLYYMRAKS